MGATNGARKQSILGFQGSQGYPGEVASLPEVRMDELPDLDDFAGFCIAVRALEVPKSYPPGTRPYYSDVDFKPTRGRCFCPGCGRYSNVEMEVVEVPLGFYLGDGAEFFEKVKRLRFRLECRQCDTVFAAIIFNGEDGPEHVLLPSDRSGLSTPNTPRRVKYFLDQAGRSETAGAYTAAVAMFRAALEQLLTDQGYDQWSLQKKLEAALKEAPWADGVDQGFVEILKKFGDYAVHPGDDIEEWGRRMVKDLHQNILRFLRVVYEAPLRNESIEQKALELEKGRRQK